MDLNAREMATMVPLVILVFWIGVFPNPFLSRMHASVAKLLNGQTDVLRDRDDAGPSRRTRGKRIEGYTRS